MTHPTTAGVLASFASLGDVIVAGAGRAARVHRPARRAADDAREASRRLRPRRVEPPLRPPRRDPAQARAEALPRPRSAALLQWPLKTNDSSRERLSKLRGHAAPAGHAAVRRRSKRLQAQLDRIEEPSRPTRRSGGRSSWRATPSGRTRSTTWSGSSRTSSSCTATAARADDPALVTGLGALRRPDGRAHRPAEGPRHQRAHAAATSGWRTRRATARRCG